MEHSSHAHPLPDEQDGFSKGSSTPGRAAYTTQSPTESLSQQTRRLQLRNAGFRGPTLPFRRISPLLGASTNGIEPFTRSANNDNNLPSAEKRRLYGEDLPRSPVNILQEIHKMSTKKKRVLPRAESGAIFEDDTGQEDASGRSWYNGGSNECSPDSPAMTPSGRNHLREISLNQKTPPPLSASLLKHVKGRNTNRGKFRSTSSETAQYIEHLESELASAHAKLDLQPSPKTSKLRAAKLKNLTTENRNLKHENSEWQKNFDSRVQEEKAKRLDIDLELTSAMRMLEDELEMKDARMAELEWELESMRVRIRDLEGLEAINQNLEKRIEALTNILVQSPTKLDLSSASTSPVRADPSKRTPRPRSMLPRLPSSPGGLRMSLPSVSESSFGHSQILAADEVESPEEDIQRRPTEGDIRPPAQDEGRASPYFRRHSGSVERRPRASASSRSGPSSASKHTSMRSSCSFAPLSWTAPDYEPKSATKQRRIRRFPSGSNSLKPLILPTTTDPPFLPPSTPLFPSVDTTARRDVSGMSSDPNTTSLSMTEEDAMLDHLGRRPSVTVAQEQTLKALEGRFQDANDFGSDGTRTSQSPPVKTKEQAMGFCEIHTDKSSRRSRPRSLQKELEEAEVKQGAECQAEAKLVETYEDGFIPVNGRQVVTSHNHGPFTVPLLAAQRRQAMDMDITPRPYHGQPPLAYTIPHPIKATPSTVLTNEHAHGIFSRLTEIITKTKQSPLTLARRLLVNAWSLGSKRLGGIGWWLLGVVYATRWHKQRQQADIGTAEDGSTSSLDSQHFSAEASRARTSEEYFRIYGSTLNQRESWLSPPHVLRGSQHHVPSPDPRAHPHQFPCDSCVEPSSRRSLRLWLQFSLTIILAVGMAIKDGPGALLASTDQHHTMPLYANPHEREPLLEEQRRKKRFQGSAPCPDEDSRPSRESQDTNGVDSGYGSIETLAPPDLEDR